MGKRDRLPDALETQRRADKRVRRQKARHKRLEQRAEMLRDAVSIDDLKEQLKVLQQLAGPAAKKVQRDGRKAYETRKGEKPRGGLDPLQAKRMQELEEKIALLEAQNDEEAARVGESDASGSDNDADAAGADRGSSASSFSSDDEDDRRQRGRGGHRAEDTGAAAAADSAMDVDGAWGAFFSEQLPAAVAHAAPSTGAAAGGTRPAAAASTKVFGVSLEAPTQQRGAATSAPAAAGHATTGAVSLAQGGTAMSFVPLAIRRRQGGQGQAVPQAAPHGVPAAGGSSAAPGLAGRTAGASTATSAATRFAAEDPLAFLASSKEAKREDAIDDDDVDDFLKELDDAPLPTD